MPPSPGSQPPSVDVPREGDLIAGKYRVERVLGKGGMGVVVAARHLGLRQRVAVKFLLPEATTLPDASERFLREAQAAVTIQSEHVARVIDVGILETGSPYIVMEYLDGADLSKVSRSCGPLPTETAVDYILQASEAIAEAHALGIVHRDLKPGNMFLVTRPDGSPLVKVLDFGLSKVTNPADTEDAALTTTQAVVGSPYYMSPEQMRGLKYADARTDVWALGVILFQLLTARRPFEGDSLPIILARVLADPPRSLRAIRPDVPAELEDVITRCLEKDLVRRVQSVSELARMLEPFAPASSRLSVDRAVRLLPGSGGANRRAAGSLGPTQIPKVQGVSALESAALTVRQGGDVSRDPTTNIASAWGPGPAQKHRTAIIIAGVVTFAAVIFSILIVVGARSARDRGAPAAQEDVSPPVASEQIAASAPGETSAMAVDPAIASNSAAPGAAPLVDPPESDASVEAVEIDLGEEPVTDASIDRPLEKRSKRKVTAPASSGEAQPQILKPTGVTRQAPPAKPPKVDMMDNW